MAEPPASGPHSDLSGVNRDARVGGPTRNAGDGDAADIAKADSGSKAQPDEQVPPAAS